ncbi:tetratricopeptide repeat protein [Spirulina subsalsa]|uniref:tetratricopeptide repeat protein n=1 Tax=Spirulina subsalsa TaxID=54311 RepID=UPI00047461A8|nr:tetratricopeptide repeat protein [Spirulina subsalsa]
MAHSNTVIYQRLYKALSVGLRRQIFVAVCDPVPLRDRLSEQLHAGQSASFPPLITVRLNAENPNFLNAIATILQDNPHLKQSKLSPTFEIIGIEDLTRKSAPLQQRFIRHLRLIERHLPQLDFSLLLWLPRPWLGNIRQAVPEFWRWHTGVFEFSSEVDSFPEESTPSRPSLPPPPPLSPLSEGEFPLVTLQFKPYSPLPIPQQEWATPRTPSPPGLDEAPPEGLDEGHLNPPESLERAADGREDTAEGETPLAVSGELQDSTQVTLEAPIDPQESGETVLEQPLEATDGETPLDPQTDSPESPPSEPIPLLFSFPSPEELEQLKASYTLESIAQGFLHLGQQYRDRIAQGDPSRDILTQAIQAYQGALDCHPTLPLAAEVLNDLGNFYWMRSRIVSDRESRRPDSPEQAFPDLEEALICYQTALLHITDPQNFATTYGMIHNNLGAAYGDLARYRDFIENMQLSIAAYEEALKYRTPDSNPTKYGSTQNNLGTAYWHLAQQHHPIENLRAAIAAYTEASQYYDPSEDFGPWAMIQNNLGTAYWNLSQYEDSINSLKKAVIAYERSLRYRTAKNAPAACAATQNNLGTAYWHLSTAENFSSRSKQDYLERAAAAYGIATQLAQQLSHQDPPIPVNFDCLATYNNLGLVHYQLATTDGFLLPTDIKLEYLEASLQAYLQALTAVPPDSEIYQTAFNYIVRTVQAFYQYGGIQGQNRALSQIPGPLLPQLLPRL